MPKEIKESIVPQEIIEQNPVDQAPNSVAAILSAQARNITDEWRFDLASGTHTARELEAYFAGRIDHHNAVIDAVATAYPALRESLPEHLDFSVVRQQLQHASNHQMEASQSLGGYAI